MSQGRVSLQRDDLWKLLVDTVHSLPMFNHHKRYVQDVMLKERPEISSQELAVQINIPLGESIVILDEIRSKGVSGSANVATSSGKAENQTLLDFDK